MSLSWRDEADGAVQVFLVIPVDEATHPFSRFDEIGKCLARIPWRYFKVLNKDSEYGLSLLTDGRLNDDITPSRCSVASMVAPFIELPLSE